MILKPIQRIKNGRPHMAPASSIHTKFSLLKKIALFFISLGIVAVSALFIWISTLALPNFNDFQNRIVQKSTQLYDRTGTILLYDIHKDYKRTVIPFDQMGDNIKQATVALEDAKFYSHIGVRPLAIMRALYIAVKTGHASQGGSTITQQIIKNTLLTSERTLTRKIKEIVLALKIERKLSKDEILAIYLNESPYGGNVYGVEEASMTYFGKHAKDLTIAQAAYIASIPQRPTYFNPFGANNDKLLARKDFALGRMKTLGMITEKQYTDALNEKLTLIQTENHNIKAPHFVFYIQDYLTDTYGEDRVNQGGFKVTTTLDYELQKQAEEIVKRRAFENKKAYNAENMGMVGIDPKTSQILFMVGSRDYFDTQIDGQYNIATAKRQPGSSFKPFVYALGFEKGYLPETVLFDVPTEFSAGCSPAHVPVVAGAVCYSPKNYDKGYRGMVSLKKALGASLNIPAVEMLYMVGVNNAIDFASSLGISTLRDSKEGFGLSLVLGGAEVKLVEMVNAYATFATGGLYKKETGILSITDSTGAKLEEYKDTPGTRVMKEDTAIKIGSVLSKDENRTLVFSPHSSLYVAGHNVAAKTGTTNNSKDAWILGYTPSLVIGAWAGNNDARPMTETGSTIAGPAWNEMFQYSLNTYPDRFPDPAFPDPAPEENGSSINPIISGHLPGDYHSLLYYVDKDNPRGPKPSNPYSDPSFSNWEAAVLDYFTPKIPESELLPPESEMLPGTVPTAPETQTPIESTPL